jgi:hypothetical protein
MSSELENTDQNGLIPTDEQPREHQGTVFAFLPPSRSRADRPE